MLALTAFKGSGSTLVSEFQNAKIINTPQNNLP